MKVLTIDIGSYSVKFLESVYERKRLIHLNAHQVLLSDIKDDLLSTNQNLIEQQLKIIKEYLTNHPTESKVILQIPDNLVTTRYFSLPTANKKKAEQMIPFQLEENLPQSLSESHYGISTFKDGAETKALVNICEVKQFTSYINKLTEYNIQPAMVTSEVSIANNFARHRNLKEPCCIIDIGHNTTKIYVIFNQQIVTSHTSYIAGDLINEAIAKTYKVSTEEAILYKHQNSFFLTEKQLEEVDEDQREFGKLMREVFMPLLLDLKRLILSFRINYNLQVQDIYLTGGTANIKNIENFLGQFLGIKTQHLNVYDPHNLNSIDLKTELKRSFGTAHIMANAYTNKLPVINFLTGKFSDSSLDDFPLKSASFIFMRSLYITLVLCLFGSFEYLFVRHFQLSNIDKEIQNTVLKDDVKLEIPKPTKNNFARDPEKVLAFLEKADSTYNKAIASIESYNQINVIKPLLKIAELVQVGSGLNIIHYENTGNSIEAIIQGNQTKDIESAETKFSKVFGEKTKTNLNSQEKQLVIHFKEK